jgi:pentatricopeptide repeat protein
MYLLFNLRLTTSVSSQVVQHALIGAYGQAGQWQNAVDIFRMMQQSGEVVLMLSSCELVQNLNRLNERPSLTGFVDYRNNQQHCHMGSSLMLALERRELMFSLILLNLASWTSPLALKLQ